MTIRLPGRMLLERGSFWSGVETTGGSAARFEISTEPVEPGASSQVSVPATVIGELREPAEIYYFVRQTGDEGTLTVPAGARSFNITLPLPAGFASIDFVGIKGIVPTKRTDTVEVSGLPQE